MQIGDSPCQSLLPIVEKLAKEYEDTVEFVKVNVEEQREIASKFQIGSIPSLFFMKGDEVVDHQKGLVLESILRNKIQSLLN